MPKALTEEERQRVLEVVEAIPKRLWVEWTGRSPAAISQQAKRYGWPVAGRHVSLPEFLRALHDWLRDRPERFGGKDRPVAVAEAEARRRRLVAQAEREELQVARLRAQLVEREEVLAAVREFGAIVGGAAERLRREFGDRAAEELNAAYDDGLRGFEARLEEAGGAPPDEAEAEEEEDEEVDECPPGS